MAGRGRKDLLRASELRASEVHCWMKQTPNSPRQGIRAPQRAARLPRTHRDSECLPKDNELPWQPQPDGGNGVC